MRKCLLHRLVTSRALFVTLTWVGFPAADGRAVGLVLESSGSIKLEFRGHEELRADDQRNSERYSENLGLMSRADRCI